MSEPIHVTDEAFEQEVLQSRNPVVVDFWAPWCGPCRMVGPILDDLAKQYAGKITIAKINTDENPQRAMEYGVQGIPTILFVKGGEEVDRIVGAGSVETYQGKIDAMLDHGETRK